MNVLSHLLFQWIHCSAELTQAFLSLAVNESRLRVATLIRPLQKNAMSSRLNRSSVPLFTQNSEPRGAGRGVSVRRNSNEAVVEVVRWFLFEYISLTYYAALGYSDSGILHIGT